MTEKSPFSKVDQIGVVVRDMDKTVAYYQSLGIGPFRLPKKKAYTEMKLRGKPVDLDSIKIKIMMAQMGPVQLELLQPVEGEFFLKEFLEIRGEGINHLGFFVDDIDRETERLNKKGFEILYSSRFQGGGGVTYFDTSKVGGILIELIQQPSC